MPHPDLLWIKPPRQHSLSYFCHFQVINNALQVCYSSTPISELANTATLWVIRARPSEHGIWCLASYANHNERHCTGCLSGRATQLGHTTKAALLILLPIASTEHKISHRQGSRCKRKPLAYHNCHLGRWSLQSASQSPSSFAMTYVYRQQTLSLSVLYKLLHIRQSSIGIVQLTQGARLVNVEGQTMCIYDD